MMLGREIIQPIDLIMGGFSKAGLSSSEYVVRLRNQLMQVHELAREQLSSAQRRQKKDYDLKAKLHSYEVGDLVYRIESIKRIGQSPKLQQVWKGPLLVIEVISPILFRVADRKKTYVLHHDRLKLCEDRDIPLWLRRKRNKLLGNPEEIDAEKSGGTPKDNASNDPTLENILDSDSLSLDKLFTPSDSACEISLPLSNELASTQDNCDSEPLTEPCLNNQHDDAGTDPEPEVVETTRSGRRRKPPQYLADYTS